VITRHTSVFTGSAIWRQSITLSSGRRDHTCTRSTCICYFTPQYRIVIGLNVITWFGIVAPLQRLLNEYWLIDWLFDIALSVAWICRSDVSYCMCAVLGVQLTPAAIDCPMFGQLVVLSYTAVDYQHVGWLHHRATWSTHSYSPVRTSLFAVWPLARLSLSWRQATNQAAPASPFWRYT